MQVCSFDNDVGSLQNLTANQCAGSSREMEHLEESGVILTIAQLV